MNSVRIASGKEACVLQLLQQPHSVCTCGVTLVGAFASAYVFCVLYSLINALTCVQCVWRFPGGATFCASNSASNSLRS